jgi:DNA invertase Pin-like site-specific DNA recombinase
MSEYVAYYRVSTEKQGRSGLGLEAQRELVLRFTGQPPISEYTEVESGRRHKNRPELIAAMAECKKFSRKLVIAKLDRLSRDVEFISSLFKSKIDFVCADNPFANKLTVQILSVVAEHEREVISERIKAALKVKSTQLASVGKKLGGPNAIETIKLARAAKRRATPSTTILEWMSNWRQQGKSFKDIADELNRLGIKTGRDSQWYPSTVRMQLNAFQQQLQGPANDDKKPPTSAGGEPHNAGSDAAPKASAQPPIPRSEQFNLSQQSRMLDADGIPMSRVQQIAEIQRRQAQSRQGR